MVWLNGGAKYLASNNMCHTARGVMRNSCCRGGGKEQKIIQTTCEHGGRMSFLSSYQMSAHFEA